MTIFGIGLHLLIALFFAIDAMRTGRKLYWLVILFMFPLLGAIAYFAAVYLPHSRLERGARPAGAALRKTLDLERDLRAAQQAFDLTPTAHKQLRLAHALLDAGEVEQAVEQYETCLRGPFANDGETNLGAARARLANNQPQPAIGLLVTLRATQPAFRPEELGLLLSSAYDAAGRKEQAGAEYEQMVQRFGTIEARAGLALWAIDQGERPLAEREFKEIDHARKHMTRQTRALHFDLFKRLDAARLAL
jgi:hypothetical protein